MLWGLVGRASMSNKTRLSVFRALWRRVPGSCTQGTRYGKGTRYSWQTAHQVETPWEFCRRTESGGILFGEIFGHPTFCLRAGKRNGDFDFGLGRGRGCPNNGADCKKTRHCAPRKRKFGTNAQLVPLNLGEGASWALLRPGDFFADTLGAVWASAPPCLGLEARPRRLGDKVEKKR